MHEHGLNIEEINLTTFCSAIESINPELVSILKEWNPPASYKIYKARYYYGTNILDQGKLQLPLKNGTTVDFDHVSVPKTLQNDLSYSSFPIGLILNNTAEVFVELESRIISLALFEAGIPLGLMETLEDEQSFCFRDVWTVSAGARTAFMLPKISDKTHHLRLQREFNCETSAPQTPLEHVPVFVDLMRKTSEYKDWFVEVLFFTTPWLKKDISNPHWVKFYYYLHRYLVKYSGFMRNKATFDLLWDYFNQALSKKKKRVVPHIFEKMKTLIIGSLGATPLFSVAYDNLRGPIQHIQKIYREVYEISYAPTIMVPTHFSIKNNIPAYFSLKHHSTFEVNPKNKSQDSLITDLAQLNSVTAYFLELVEQGKLKLETTIISDILNSVEFNFYHCGAGEYRNISDTILLPETDSGLRAQLGSAELLEFPYTNSFLRSCVQLKKHNL
ncbi:MAG: hypothetical protein HKM04_06865 [Legionellales bacterium]|nr:hypothetical protein [Legionellales bacterium]